MGRHERRELPATDLAELAAYAEPGVEADDSGFVDLDGIDNEAAFDDDTDLDPTA